LGALFALPLTYEKLSSPNQSRLPRPRLLQRQLPILSLQFATNEKSIPALVCAGRAKLAIPAQSQS
jgi:hypothetical protein